MARLPKTVLILEVDNKEFDLKYTGSIEFPEDKIGVKHDERIIQAMLEDDRLYKLFFRLVDPVTRYKKREAKRK